MRGGAPGCGSTAASSQWLASSAAPVVALAWPGPTALVPVLLFGLFSMVYGVSEVVVGVQMRRTGQTLQAVLHDAAA